MHFCRYLFLRIFCSGNIVVDEVVGTMANYVDYPFFPVFIRLVWGNISVMVLSLHHRVIRCQVLFYELTCLLMLPSIFGQTFVSHRPDWFQPFLKELPFSSCFARLFAFVPSVGCYLFVFCSILKPDFICRQSFLQLLFLQIFKVNYSLCVFTKIKNVFVKKHFFNFLIPEPWFDF